MTRRLAIVIVTTFLVLGICRLSFADRYALKQLRLGQTVTQNSVIPAIRWGAPFISGPSIQPAQRPQIGMWYETLLTDISGTRSEVVMAQGQDRSVAIYLSREGELIAAESPSHGTRSHSTAAWTTRVLHRGRKHWFDPQMSLQHLANNRMGLAWVSQNRSLNYSEWTLGRDDLRNETIESEVPGFPMYLGLQPHATPEKPFLAYFSESREGHDPENIYARYTIRIVAPDTDLGSRPWTALELASYQLQNRQPVTEDEQQIWDNLQGTGIIGTARSGEGPVLAWTTPNSGKVTLAQYRGWDLLGKTQWMVHELPVTGRPRILYEQSLSQGLNEAYGVPQKPLVVGIESLDGKTIRLAHATTDTPGGADDWAVHTIDSTVDYQGGIRLLPSSPTSMQPSFFYLHGNEMRRARAATDFPTRTTEWHIDSIPWVYGNSGIATDIWSQGLLMAGSEGLVQISW